MGKMTGNAGYGNPKGQKEEQVGYKKPNPGFGEDLSKATGSAGMGKQVGKDMKCNTPEGQKVV